jgi:3-keto-5-aminohexanoate cleavage enzyme
VIDKRDIYKDLPNRRTDLGHGFIPELVKWKIPDTISVTVQPTGGPAIIAKNPHQLYTPDKILKSAMECIETGSRWLHLHVRGADGLQPKDLQQRIRMMHQVIDPIREKYGWSVIIDGSECTMSSFAEEKVLLDADLSEIVPVNMHAYSPARLIQAEAYYLEEKGVKPGIAVHTEVDIEQAKELLVDTGILRKPIYWGVLPGSDLGGSPLPDELAMAEYLVRVIRRIRQIEPDCFISVPAPGHSSMYLATQAILLGQNIRIGVEDTCYKWPHKDDLIENVTDIVSGMITIAKVLGRRVATADESRVALGMPTKEKKR